MQISGGLVVIGGFGPGPAMSAEPAPPPFSIALGDLVNWTPGTYVYTTNRQFLSGDDFNYYTANTTWQVLYSHQAIKMPAGANVYAVITSDFGQGYMALSGVVSSSSNILGNFSSNVVTKLSNVFHVWGGNSFNNYGEVGTTTELQIPANKYFLLGITGGPTAHKYRKTSNNITFVYNSNPVVTVVNEVYTDPRSLVPIGPDWWADRGQQGVPFQLGGNVSGYTKITSNIHYSALKFVLL